MHPRTTLHKKTQANDDIIWRCFTAVLFFFLFECVFRSVLTLFTWKPLSAHWVPVASGLNFTWTWLGNLSTHSSYAFHSNAVSLETIEWVSNAPTGFSTSAHIHNGGRFQSSDMRRNETAILLRSWRPHNASNYMPLSSSHSHDTHRQSAIEPSQAR